MEEIHHACPGQESYFRCARISEAPTDGKRVRPTESAPNQYRICSGWRLFRYRFCCRCIPTRSETVPVRKAQNGRNSSACLAFAGIPMLESKLDHCNSFCTPLHCCHPTRWLVVAVTAPSSDSGRRGRRSPTGQKKDEPGSLFLSTHTNSDSWCTSSRGRSDSSNNPEPGSGFSRRGTSILDSATRGFPGPSRERRTARDLVNSTQFNMPYGRVLRRALT